MKYILPFLALSLIMAGCAGQKELIEEQRTALQRLADANSELEAEIAVLQDSLQFVDDIETGQYYRDRRQLEQTIDRLEYEFALCKDSSEVPLTEIATFGADDLFAPASANISDAGAHRLSDVLDEIEASSGRTIRIEGHSDSVPLGPGLLDRYPSNWELSAARASAVARFYIEEHGILPDQIEVAAFGDTRPIASNQTGSGRSQNRRVSIYLY